MTVNASRLVIVLHFTIFRKRRAEELLEEEPPYFIRLFQMIQPTILSIAGSDPSGGAGIQADLKTMTSIGVYGAAAITCLTVQNSQGVQQIHPVSADLVRAQVEAILKDHNVSHIKIGMVGTMEIVETLGNLLTSFPGSVIFDPVLAASSGAALVTETGTKHLASHLLNKINFLTPNANELGVLTNRKIHSIEDAIHSAHLLLNTYPYMNAIIVKGGHLNESQQDQISDFLIQQNGTQQESRRKRIQNNNLHGTGCTYASAFASYLSRTNDCSKAFQLAGKYMDSIIRFGVNKTLIKSKSNGPLFHAFTCS